MTEVAFFDENAPLDEDELQRLEHNALAMVARDYLTACPQCELEAPLVVRALIELRELREAQKGCDSCGGIPQATTPDNVSRLPCGHDICDECYPTHREDCVRE